MNDLLDAFPVEESDVDRLRGRLAAAAEAEGILDVAYRTVDTPVGPLLLAATEQGLVRVAYPNQGHDAVLQALADRISPRVLHAPARLDPVARQLDDYFAGRRRRFDVPLDQLRRLFRLSGKSNGGLIRVRHHRPISTVDNPGELNQQIG